MAVTNITTVPLNKANLALYWKSHQIALIDMTQTTDHKIVAVYALRKVISGTTYTFNIAIWVQVDESNVKQLKVGVSDTIPDTHRDNPFDFDDDAGAMWLDKGAPGTNQNDHTVVGTGDVRGITESGNVTRFKLNETADEAVIITCPEDYKLTVYVKNGPNTAIAVPSNLVKN